MSTIIRRKSDTNTPGYAMFDEWDPFRVMQSMLRGERAQNYVSRRGGGTPSFTPTFDVKETKDSYLFHADLPGVKESDVDLSLVNNRLTISGKREFEGQQEGDNYFLYERTYGNFTRAFTLPDGIDSEHVNAQMKDGVLTIVVPKKAEAQPRRISLNQTQATTTPPQAQPAKA